MPFKAFYLIYFLYFYRLKKYAKRVRTQIKGILGSFNLFFVSKIIRNIKNKNGRKSDY